MEGKSKIIILSLILVIVLENGYLLYESLYTADVSKFENPTCGKDVYEHLKKLECKVYRGDDLWPSGTKIDSYQAFLDLAKGETVVVCQMFHYNSRHEPPSPPYYAEGVSLQLCLKNGQAYVHTIYWGGLHLSEEEKLKREIQWEYS